MKKLRIIEILIMIITIRLTPVAIKYADSVRGYKAYGSEYLLPLFGLLIVFLVETAIDVYKSFK